MVSTFLLTPHPVVLIYVLARTNVLCFCKQGYILAGFHNEKL